MPKKRNDNEIWGQNESWSGDDEGWDYKPAPPDIRQRTASQRREFAERIAQSQDPDDSRPNRRPRSRAASDAVGRSRTPNRGGPPTRRPPGKSILVYFYIGTLLIAVVICLFLFAMAFQSITSNHNPIVASTPDPSGLITSETDDELNAAADENTRSFTGVITALGPVPNNVTVLNIESKRDDSFKVLDKTVIKDRYGTSIVYNELYEGMIVDVGYQAQTLDLVSLSESTDAWRMDYETGIEVDVEASAITVHNESYTYNSRSLITYKDEPYPVSQITEMDTVSLTGFGSDVWSIRLEGSHGFLELENIDGILEGTISVGTLHRPLIEVIEPLPLAEGPHRVIVEGQNIEPFIKDISVASNETVSLNLIDVTLKPGELLVTASEPDSEIFIDGVAVTEPGPIEIEFGQHVVRVEKDQFMPVEQIVDINKSYQELSVILTRLVNNATIKISTFPTPAEVYIDNVFVGLSPWTQPISTGQHTVVARLNGYNDTPPLTWDLTEGLNERILILLPASSDPIANLPPPDNTQPIIEEPIVNPTPDPFAPPTQTPTQIPTDSYYPPETVPTESLPQISQTTFPTPTPIPYVTYPTPTPIPQMMYPTPTPIPSFTEQYPPNLSGTIYEEDFTP